MSSSINNAILQLRKRAEKYPEDQLIKTFVDVGSLFTLLTNPDHQILYGRRGTGKTHILSFLNSQKKKEGNCCINIDLRTIGSTGGLYSDSTISIAERATRLLVDSLSVIHNQILDFAIDDKNTIDLSKLGPVLDELSDAITEVQILGPIEKERTYEDSVSSESDISMGMGLDNMFFGIGNKDSCVKKAYKRENISGIERHRIHFPSIRICFEKIVKIITPKEIWIILDEWAEIPMELQPFLADLLRRTLFPLFGISVKIGAIEHRSNFRFSQSASDYIGIETGADVTSLNLDEFMVFDNNEYLSIDFFKNLIFRHISSFLPEDLKVKHADDFVNVAFTQINAFEEFVRASEGVPRDAINILVNAAMKAGSDKISIFHIRDSARTWYNRDKEKSISSNVTALQLLRWIIDVVIKNRNARAFLLRTDTESDLINYLYDARVLHLIKQSVSGKDTPGIRYNVYSIDFGCYVDLINTSKAPKGLFEVETEEGLSSEFVNVPRNDYRAIRRAILELSDFHDNIK